MTQNQLLSNRPVITWLLSVINVGVYVGLIISGADWWFPEAYIMIQWGAGFDALILEGEPWRLVTSIFLHAGPVHLILNIAALIYLGLKLEKELGSIRFLFIYLYCGLAASMMSTWYHNFQVFVGASGAIFGLLGLYTVRLFNRKDLFYRANFVIAMVVVILINLGIGWLIPFIDNGAHLGGLISGVVWGLGSLISRRIKGYRLLRNYGGYFLASGLLWAVFYAIPAYPGHYYALFQAFIYNEKESARIVMEGNYLFDEFYRSRLSEAKKLWQINADMVENFPWVEDSLINVDIETLCRYTELRKKGIDYRITAIEKDSYLYFDSVDILNDAIRELPDLHYPLYFEPPNDSSQPDNSLEPFVMYYDSAWDQTVAEQAVYYRIGTRDSLGRVNSWVKDYYLSGKVQMKGHYFNDLMDGLFFFYHPNGGYDAVGIYKLDSRQGKWQYFYPNGQIRQETRYEKSQVLMMQGWDRNGNQLICDGNGLWELYSPHGRLLEKGWYQGGLKEGKWVEQSAEDPDLFEEYYEKGQLKKGLRITPNGRRFPYTEVYAEPEPLIGYDAYQKYLADNLDYPPMAFTQQIEGLIWVEFEVDTAGEVSKLLIKNNLGGGTADEAKRLILQNPVFNPAMLRGKRITAKTQIPVLFELQN